MYNIFLVYFFFFTLQNNYAKSLETLNRWTCVQKFCEEEEVA